MKIKDGEKKKSPNIIAAPHASYYIVLTKVPGQGFGYESNYADDKKHSFPFFVSLVHSIVYPVKTQEPQVIPSSAAHSLFRRKKGVSP